MEDLGQAPVHHQDLAEGTNHDVFRFQIAVQHAAHVRKRHGLTNPLEEAQPVWKRLDMLKMLIEAPALDELHGVENPSVGQRAYIVDRHDAWWLQSREDARFTEQPRGELTRCV